MFIHAAHFFMFITFEMFIIFEQAYYFERKTQNKPFLALKNFQWYICTSNWRKRLKWQICTLKTGISPKV